MAIRLKKILFVVLPAMALMLLPAGRAFAGFTINNATVSFNNGAGLKTSTITINSGGVLNGSYAVLAVTDRWENNGAFNAGTSTVAFENSGATITIAGNTTFYNFVSEAAGSTITFAAGSVQTVGGQFLVRGALGSSLKLRSSSDGDKWSLAFPNGVQAVEYVDVRDSDALLNAITAYNSRNSGNNNAGWVFPPGCSAGATVAQSGGDYTSIQTALDNLNHTLSEDTCVIILDEGPYAEAVNVTGFTSNDHRLIIKAADTFTSSGPVISPASGNGFTIGSDSVTLQGLMVQASAGNGIHISTAAYFEIKQTTITLNTNSYRGLSLFRASSGTISNVYISNPSGDAAGFLTYSDVNNISDTVFVAGDLGTPMSAIYTDNSSDNTFTGITVYNPTSYGVHFKGGGYNVVRQSTMTGSTSDSYPVYFESGPHKVENSYIQNISGNGAWLNSGTISYSTVTTSIGGYFAIDATGSGVQVDNSFVTNTAGTAIYAGGSIGISYSTISASGSAGNAVYGSNASVNVNDSYLVSAGTAVYLMNGGYNFISSSTLLAAGGGGTAIYTSGVNYSTVAYSYLLAPTGMGAHFYSGSYNAVLYTTITANAWGYAIRSSNYGSRVTLDHAYISNLSSSGVFLEGGSYHTISSSTIEADCVGGTALYTTGISYSTVAYSYLHNPSGTGMYFASGGNISVVYSTVAANSVTGYAFYSSGASYLTLANSYFNNPSGTGGSLNSGSGYNSISFSTITGGGNGYYGINLNGISSNNTLSGSYVSGSTAVYAANASGQFFGNSFVAVSAAGSGIALGTNGFPVFYGNLITGGTGGIGINLKNMSSGTPALSSNTVLGGAYGLVVPTAWFSITIDSITFQDLSPGATGIMFLGDGSAATYSRVAFNSENIAVNVNGLARANTVTMSRPAGPRSGTLYEKDSTNKVNWPALPAGCNFAHNVALGGTESYSSIQAAVDGMGTALSTASCVAITDSSTYPEQVTVKDISTNGYRLYIRPFSATSPVISPPGASTAAFHVMVDSVTLQGLRVSPSGSVTYGIISSSAMLVVSSVSVNSNNYISGAGISISSRSLVECSSITVQSGHGLLITGSTNTVLLSTMTSTSVTKYALYLFKGSSNTIDRSYVYNPDGGGARLETGTRLNYITYSTIASGGSAYTGLYVYFSDSNTVTNSYIGNTDGYGARLSGANFNNIALSTMSGYGGSLLGLYLQNSDTNTVTASFIRNPGGSGVYLNTGSDFNEISYSTMTGGGATYSGLYINNSGSNSVTWSAMSNPTGYGSQLLNADFNKISSCTVSGGSGHAGLYIQTSDSNTVANSYIFNPYSSGHAVDLDSSASYNKIRNSTMTTTGIGYAALNVDNASSNTVSGAYMYAPSGFGAQLLAGSGFNEISFSTMTGGGSARYGLFINNSDFNKVSDSFVGNPSGHAARLYGGADFNTISYSTITGGNVAGYTGLYIFSSSTNAVYNSYIQGSTAAYITGSVGTIIGGSVFVATNTAGYGLRLAGASEGLALATSTLAGGALGTGIYLDDANSGVISLSSNIINVGQYGLNIGAQSTFAQVSISSITFKTLTTGATAINFLPGRLVATFARAQFDAPGIAVNVNGSPLETGSLITMRRASGSKGGPAFENDVNNYVTWGPAALLLSPEQGAVAVSQSAGLYARTPDAEPGAVLQYQYQVDTGPTMDSAGGNPQYNLEQSAAQLYTNQGAFSGQDATISVSSDAYFYSSTATFVFYSTGTSRLQGDAGYFWRVRAKEAGGYYGDWTSTAAFATGLSAAQSPVNNIAITGVNLYGPARAGVNIGFTIAENNVVSSETPRGALYNTADWIFVKFSTQAGAEGTWNHATLTGGAVDAGASFAVATDSAGVFLNHTANAPYWTAGTTVTWNFKADGVSFMNTAVVKVFAISMVHVPEGQFKYNMGATNDCGLGPNTNVDSVNVIPTSADSGWPNGHNSFYIMRYELTQGLYADFLNSVPASTAAARYASQNTLITFSGGLYTAVAPFAVKNWLSTADLWSFLSWAALRPMTEMEFERAARDVSSDMRTYPWGDTAPDGLIYNSPNEGGAHNRNFMSYRANGFTYGPLDAGRYMSGDVYRTPEQTGASPYGIADLAGNLYEQVLNCTYLSVPTGGNGTTVWPNWPAPDSSQKGLRGGGWFRDESYANVSYRGTLEVYWSYPDRNGDIGGRGVRAP